MTTTTPTTGPTFRPGPGGDTLEELAWRIDRDGVARHEAAITRLVTWARAMGHDPVLLDVLSDPVQPEAARERAFGALSRLVASTETTGRRPWDPRFVAA